MGIIGMTGTGTTGEPGGLDESLGLEASLAGAAGLRSTALGLPELVEASLDAVFKSRSLPEGVPRLVEPSLLRVPELAEQSFS